MRRYVLYCLLLLSVFFFISCSSNLSPISDIFNESELITSKHIPDRNFREFVTVTMALVTLDDCSRETILTMEFKEVEDLTGIEYFTALRELHLSYNRIVELPQSLTELRFLNYIDVRSNPLSQQTRTWLKNTFIYTDLYPNFALYIDE